MDSTPRTTSAIWEHFTTSPADGTKVSCKLYKATIIRQGCEMPVMHNHMHLKHPFVTMSAQAPPAVDNTQPQPPITAVFTSKTTYTKQIAEQIKKTLGDIICQDLLSYSVVENTGFRNLLTVTAPCYRVPSRMHISHTVGPNL